MSKITEKLDSIYEGARTDEDEGVIWADGGYETYLSKCEAEILAAQWTSVEEGLPEAHPGIIRSEDYLVRRDGYKPIVAYYDHETKRWYSSASYFMLPAYITHYQPITAPGE